MKSFVSFIILFRYRVYKKCVEVFKKSLRFGDFFAAQNDNSAQNQRDAENALNRQRLVENKRSDDRADDRLDRGKDARAARLHALKPLRIKDIRQKARKQSHQQRVDRDGNAA